MQPDPRSPIRADAMTSILEEAKQLRLDYQQQTAESRRSSRILMGAIAALIALIIPMVILLIINTQVMRQSNETARVIADCTTPGGRCYDEGRSRTSGAIGDIVRASVYMSQCSRLYPGEYGEEFDRKLEACVNERLSKAATQRQSPSPSPSVSPSTPASAGAPR